MPTFKVDLSQTIEFKTPNEGTYLCIVRRVKPGISQNGNPKLEIVVEIEEAFDAANDEFIGQNLFDYPVTVGAGAFRAGQFIEAVLGHAPEPDEEFDTDELLEQRVVCKVTHEVWEEEDDGDGSVRARIAKYMMAEGGGVI